MAGASISFVAAMEDAECAGAGDQWEFRVREDGSILVVVTGVESDEKLTLEVAEAQSLVAFLSRGLSKAVIG